MRFIFSGVINNEKIQILFNVCQDISAGSSYIRHDICQYIFYCDACNYMAGFDKLILLMLINFFPSEKVEVAV